jgi:hypothetical protein
MSFDPYNRAHELNEAATSAGRRLASRADFHGRVVGIDRSAESLPDKGHLICKTPRLSY